MDPVPDGGRARRRGDDDTNRSNRSSDRVRALLLATTAVAAVATAGSLYFSLGLGLVPCDLCWYQRILMYPLVVVLGVAAVERRAGVWRTGLVMSVLGVVVAAYHSYLQVAPGGEQCSLGGGCASILYPMLGGALTIPRLSLVAFSLVTLGLLALARVESTPGRSGRSLMAE